MISLNQQWIVYQGMAFGMPQPTMVGVLSSEIDPSKSVQNIFNLLAAWLNLDKSTQARLTELNARKDPSPIGQDQCIIEGVLLLLAKIQHQHKIPTSEQFKIQPIKTSQDKGSFREYQIVLPYSDAEVNRDILLCLVHVTNYCLLNTEALSGLPQHEIQSYFAEATEHLYKLREKLNGIQLGGMNTFWFIHAAHQLNLHVSFIANNVIQFGTGEQSILMDSSFTEHTSVIGSGLSKSKAATALLLNKHGLPGATHYPVYREAQLAELCEKLEFPVVIKPDNLDQGNGVFAHLTDLKQVKKAFKTAAKLSKHVLLEKHVFGDDYRLTVLNNDVIKVVKRTAGGVLGDGTHTIRQLLATELQSDYAQEVYRQTNKAILSLDDEAKELLKAQKLSADDIPKQGKYVALRRKSNMSTGGTVTAVDIKDVHPDNIALVCRAAKAANLDLAGVDLLIEDIRSSWLSSNAIICEINAQPQIGATISPVIYQTILRSLLKQKTGIPLHLKIVPESPDKSDLAQTEKAATALNCNLITSLHGQWQQTSAQCHKSERKATFEPITKGFENGYAALNSALLNKSATGIMAIMTLSEVLMLGLPCASFASITIFQDDFTDSKHTEKAIQLTQSHTNSLVTNPWGGFGELQ